MRIKFSPLLQDRRLSIGLAIFLLICLLSILQPVEIHLLIGNVSPMAQGKFNVFEDPSPAHWLGTDRYGRDVLSLLLLGLRFSLSIGLLAGTFSTFVGVSVGLIAGFYGGRVDSILRSVTDVVLGISTLPLLITLSGYVKTIDVLTMAFLFSIFGWPFSSWTIRPHMLSFGVT